MSGTETVQESSEKEKFKVEVGVASYTVKRALNSLGYRFFALAGLTHP